MKKFKLNQEGVFSITKPYESSQIISIINDYCNPSELTITDGTACMGGDLVNFSYYFKFVNGIEIDKNNFECLVENCNRFNCKNIRLINDDYLNIYDKINQDIIYLDPPWGGVEYKNKKEVFLKLNNYELKDLILKIFEKNITKFLFIKVPLNICLDSINPDKIETIFNKTREVFKLLIFKAKVNEVNEVNEVN